MGRLITQRLALAAMLAVIFSVGTFILFRKDIEKTEITTVEVTGDNGRGRVTEGSNMSDSGRLSTDDTAIYESTIIDSPKPSSNAAVLHWDQTGTNGEVIAGFRIHDGDGWTDWVESPSENEGKDGAPIEHAALVLAKRVHKIQYRFEVIANETQLSPIVDLRSAKIELVDTTKGPSPTKSASLAERIMKNLGFVSTAKAHTDEPRIISRAEWGAPEPNSSTRWPSQYRRLERVIVHHTAAASTGDSAAAVRAVWHFHANSRGWGDIGYNYLVDQSGNLFEGRYYDKDYAELISQDVVGGHALTYNYGSSGISALGDFTNSQPSDAMLRSISNLAAYKLYRYGVSPSSWQGGLPAVIGHRDVSQTSCPGSLHNHLTTIRSLATTEFAHFNDRPFSVAENDVVKSMNSGEVYLIQGGERRLITSSGQRDCYIMAFSGRMRSVTDANIASLPLGSTAGGCTPPNYTWFHPTNSPQQYVLLYGGMYPVGYGDVIGLGGANKARPLSDEGIQYLNDSYVNPEIPGHILIKGATQPAIYDANNNTLQHVTDYDTRDCLVAQYGEVKSVPDSLISTYQTDGKITGGSASCTTTTGLILNPDGITTAQVAGGERRYVGNGAVLDCIRRASGAGTPYRVSQHTWDSFDAGEDAYCPYESVVRFVKEADDPTVWRILGDGTKQHADGFCVVDPFTTPLDRFRVWIVAKGEPAGHTYDGVFNATSGNCQAII